MKSYCVKQRRQTDCVQGSEQYVKTKNGRNAMKCKRAECGITKFRFVKSSAQVTRPKGTTERARIGKGLSLGRNSPFNKIPIIGAIL